MDWSPVPEAAAAREYHQQQHEIKQEPAAAVAELHELSFSMLPSSLNNSSGRRLGRKISHKKSASDTFAFAAGQHDFLALLAERPPLEPAAGHHARHASSGAGLAGSPSPDADQQMAAGSEQAGSSLAHAAAAAAPTADADAAAAALGRTGPASASDPGTAAAAAAAAAGPSSSSAAAAAGAEETSPSAAGGSGTQTRSNALDTTQLDPRKAKRILANRQSAQRSRMKRLQYINELEGRKSKAEAGVRELRSKVDRAQRQHKTLAKEVEGMSAEASALQQQLLYEQSVQASLSSYVQSLQLQMQQQQQPQQQWGSGQLHNGYQMQQQGHVQQYSGTAADMYRVSDGSYSYKAAVQMQQYNGLMTDTAGHVQDHQHQHHQQQWAGYSTAGVHSTHHQHQQHPGQQQQQGYDYSQGYGYSQAAHLQQQGFAAAQHPSTSTMHHPAAHRRSLSDASAASGHGAHVHTAGLPATQQQQQHPHYQHSSMQHAAGACAAGGGSSSLTAAAAAAAAAAAGAAGGGHTLAPPQQRTSAAGGAMSPEGVSVGVQRGSISQGSGSVLVHGSVSEAELDSLLGLGSGFGADSAGGMEPPDGSQEAVVGLLAAGGSGLLLAPDDLLVQEDGGSLLP